MLSYISRAQDFDTDREFFSLVLRFLSYCCQVCPSFLSHFPLTCTTSVSFLFSESSIVSAFLSLANPNMSFASLVESEPAQAVAGRRHHRAAREAEKRVPEPGP